MSAAICPTILAEEPEGLQIQIKRVLPFAHRIHIDLMDGVFASPRSVALDQLSWPDNVTVDIHLMYKQPMMYSSAFLALKPHLVIVHAEAVGSFVPFADTLHQHGIETGVALLPLTSVTALAPALPHIDHVLIFSGHLGHFGGEADLRLLRKISQLRLLKPKLEIGWDGGVNSSNVHQLATSGIDVLNVGGFIQHALHPAEAYAALESLV